METQELIGALGYAQSPHFLSPDRFDEIPALAHVFRTACRHSCLKGVYLLRDTSPLSTSATPVVYVTQAKDHDHADLIHRQIWNQNCVPFLIVCTPLGARLYSGFNYERSDDSKVEDGGVLESLVTFDEVTRRLSSFRAEEIDNGNLWREWGDTVRPEGRVDHRLLHNLEVLGRDLRHQGIPREAAHALIGKMVYLRYLRDRNILSDRRLEQWGLRVNRIFGRQIDRCEIQRLVSYLDDWLNGEIFPISLTEHPDLSRANIEKTASVFLGDEILTGQLHLDFQAYDFSYIPVETLSTIYEQFLAIEGVRRETGAVYTPVSVVNFMVAEMEDQQPISDGMRVLDPSCGSGAFLVQCYRHLIEKRMAKARRKLRPSELRDILVRQIFGVDRDGDACRVTELSLVLTMLDYIDPPDLKTNPTFRLPCLHDTNIYQCDFLAEHSEWTKGSGTHAYDWIVGNPPWIEISSDSARDRDCNDWLARNSTQNPVTLRQTAEMFAWEAGGYVSRTGLVALLVPAMTLFKRQSDFRAEFFSRMEILAIANFTNLRRDLFVRYVGGRKEKMEIPAAAFFFRTGGCDPESGAGDRGIPVFSPFLANQEANRPKSTTSRGKIWNLVVNASEIQFVDSREVASGAMLPWKLAMWGTDRDRRLLARVKRQFIGLGPWSEIERLSVSEGIQLRKRATGEAVEPVPEVVGKKRLNTAVLRDQRHVHSVVGRFVVDVTEESGFVRRGRKRKPLAVCRPPHVVVSAARTFAIYTDEYLVIPPRQIGIAGTQDQSLLLKALALYLSSDFATYYEFFKSPQWGIRDGRSTLETLRDLPLPLAEFDTHELEEWGELHRELAEASARRWGLHPLPGASDSDQHLRALERELNRRVAKSLNLTVKERWLVNDLVQVRMSISDGNLGHAAISKPSRGDLTGYAEMLRDELDSFLEEEPRQSHSIIIWLGEREGLVAVELISRTQNSPAPVTISDSLDPVSRTIDGLHVRHQETIKQWIYFDRNLFIYDRDKTLILKPQQRIWWTRSQAMNDAGEIIAAALVPGNTI